MSLAADQARTDGAAHTLLIVLDNGISNLGAPAITTTSSQATPQEVKNVIAFAAAHRQIPTFPAGTRAYLSGAGYGAAPQKPLTPAQRDTIQTIWSGILTRAGAHVTVLPAPDSTRPVETHRTVPTIQPATQPQLSIDGATITLPGDVLFDTDSATLRPAATPSLTALRNLIRNRPGTVTITGWTDRTGTTAHNNTLSLQRAQTVTGWLHDHGIPAARLGAPVGAGETGPDPADATYQQLQAARHVTATLTAP